MVKPKTVPTRPPARGHGSSSRSMTPPPGGGVQLRSRRDAIQPGGSPGIPPPFSPSIPRDSAGIDPVPPRIVDPVLWQGGGVKEGPARDFLAVPYGPVLGAQRGGGMGDGQWAMQTRLEFYPWCYPRGKYKYQHGDISAGVRASHRVRAARGWQGASVSPAPNDGSSGARVWCFLPPPRGRTGLRRSVDCCVKPKGPHRPAFVPGQGLSDNLIDGLL